MRYVCLPCIAHKPCLHKEQGGDMPHLECYHTSDTTKRHGRGQLEVDHKHVFAFPSPPPPSIPLSLSPKLVMFLLKRKDDWPHIRFFCEEVPMVNPLEVRSID